MGYPGENLPVRLNSLFSQHEDITSVNRISNENK